MPASRSTFPCFHKGFGAFCHRCKQATDLEEKAKALQGKALPEGMTKKDFQDMVNAMFAEAKRLKGTKNSRNTNVEVA